MKARVFELSIETDGDDAILSQTNPDAPNDDTAYNAVRVSAPLLEWTARKLLDVHAVNNPPPAERGQIP